MLRKTVLVLFSLFCAELAIAQEVWTLQKCIDYAFQQNIQIKQGELGLQSSEVNRMQTRANTLPAVNGSFSHGYNWGQTIDPFTNSFATSCTLVGTPEPIPNTCPFARSSKSARHVASTYPAA